MTSILPRPATRVAIDGEVVDVAAEADVGQDLAAELVKVSLNTLALPMPALVFSYSSTAVRALSLL